MADVTLPLPLAAAGAVLCVLGGYIVGAAAGPEGPRQATADVVSYDELTDELCLAGEAVEVVEGADGEVCGTWRHRSGADAPEPGDRFRFVTMTSEDGSGESVTYIYGDVVS